MEEEFDSDLAKELLTVLAYCEESFQEKISDELVSQLITLAADSTKEFYIEEDKNLKDQNLSEECKDILSMLYYQCISKEEQEKLLRYWLKKDYI